MYHIYIYFFHQVFLVQPTTPHLHTRGKQKLYYIIIIQKRKAIAIYHGKENQINKMEKPAWVKTNRALILERNRKIRHYSILIPFHPLMFIIQYPVI